MHSISVEVQNSTQYVSPIFNFMSTTSHPTHLHQGTYHKYVIVIFNSMFSCTKIITIVGGTGLGFQLSGERVSQKIMEERG